MSNNQKGKIDPSKPTLKHMMHGDRVAERRQELKGLRDGQTLKLHTPKQK